MLVRNRFRTLALSSTALAFGLAGAAIAQPIEQVIVTGSHIRGVAPVGSTIVSVGSDDLKKTGAAQTTDLLNRVPQFATLGANEQSANGGTRVQGAAGNTTFSRSVNLRGIGQESTLVLFNGQRFTKNSLSDAVDVDLFPPALVERVEVVADGASAIYGSDAIAGTVNIILKEPQDIIETTFQVGIKNGSMDWLASQALGVTWDEAGSGIGDGGLTIVYQHSYVDSIDAADRGNLYNDDLSPYIGAAGLSPAFASPGNLRGFGAGAANTARLFAVPTGIASNQGVTLGQLGQANQPNRQNVWLHSYPLPKITRDTLGGVFNQQLTDWLKFSFWGAYTRRSGAATYGSQPSIATNIAVPTSNPYGPCATPAAAALVGRAAPSPANTQGLTCPAGNITLQYNWANELGTDPRSFTQTQYNMAGSFDIQLPYEWHAKFTKVYGKDAGQGTFYPVNATALAQVVTGVGKPANVPYLNPFCDNTAAPCNSPLTRAYVSATSTNSNTNWVDSYNIAFDGPLWDLPGGAVRMAIGGDWSRSSLIVYNYNTNSAAIGTRVISANSHGWETVRSVFGELYIPIIGDSNAMPGVRKLELTLAGRLTDYSAFGTTRDPKVGLNWSPIDELKIHASWGTSFRAPNLRQNDPTSAATIFSPLYTCGAFVGVNLAACPGGASTSVSIITSSGGNGGLRPETARSYSLGADWTPEFLPGFTASLTYYYLHGRSRLTQALRDAGDLGAPNAAGGIYDGFIQFNPTFFPTRALNNQPYVINGAPVNTRTQAEYDAFINAIVNVQNEYKNTSGAQAARNVIGAGTPILMYADGRFINSGVLQTDGLDYSARYDFDTDWGSAFVGAGGSYTLSYKQTGVSTAPLVDNVNTFGQNYQFRVRGEAGVEVDGISGSIFLNHQGSYDVDPAYLPPATPVQYRTVDSYTTVDLAFSYNTGDEIGMPVLRNIQLIASIVNVLDTYPPLMLNGGASNAIQFDPNAGSAVGRMITLRVIKSW